MYILWLCVCVCACACVNMYLSFTHVHVHAVVTDWNGLQVEVSHAVDLQLEGECGLQVPVDPVLYELKIKHN